MKLDKWLWMGFSHSQYTYTGCIKIVKQFQQEQRSKSLDKNNEVKHRRESNQQTKSHYTDTHKQINQSERRVRDLGEYFYRCSALFFFRERFNLRLNSAS